MPGKKKCGIILWIREKTEVQARCHARDCATVRDTFLSETIFH